MKKHTHVTFGILGLALFAGASQASADVESLIGDDFSGEISAGWDSRYFYRGLWFGDETAWTNIQFDKELATNLTGSINLFYTDVMDDALTYSEGNIGATLSYESGFGTFDFGYIHYRFYDGFAGSVNGVRGPGVNNNEEANELNLTYTTNPFWGLKGHMLIARDLTINGTYGEFGIIGEWDICGDRVGLNFAAVAGYSLDNYYSANLGNGDEDEGWTHVAISLALPIMLNETVTLTPHISTNISSESRQDTNTASGRGDDEIFYGAAMSVSF